MKATYKIKDFIEKRFENLGRYVFRKRYYFLFFSLLVTALFASQIPKTVLDASTLGFYHKDDPTRVTYESFKEQFGLDEVVVILITPSNIYDLGFLRKLKRFHKELEAKVPYLDEVKSLINVTSTWGEEDELVVEALMKDFPETELMLKEKIRRIRATPLYNNLIISANEKHTAVLVRSVAFSAADTNGAGNNAENEPTGFDEEFDTGLNAEFNEYTLTSGNPQVALSNQENAAFLRMIYKIAGKYNSVDFPIEIAGSPVIIDTVRHHLETDTPRFTMGCLVAIAIVLLLIFRRVSGVVYPLIVVFLSMVSTLGIMAFFSAPITSITQILPAFILVVGVCDSIHILALFYTRVDQKQEKEDAIAFAFRHSGLAILMTSLTTAGGLMSFIPATMLPVTHLGIYAPVGVLLALVFTFVFLPALLAITPIKIKNASKGAEQKLLLNNVLLYMGRVSIKNPWRIVFATLVFAVLAVAGMNKLMLSHNHLAWLPDDEPVKIATHKIDQAMNGSITAEFIIDTKQENGLHQPEVMQKLDTINQTAEKYKQNDLFVGKSFSIVDTLKNTHKALNENRMEFYGIPQEKKLIAQELLLFENGGTDDLERLVDSQYSKARITMKLPWHDANRYVSVMDELETQVKHIIGDRAEVTQTGRMALFTRTIFNVMQTMTRSYLIAGIFITLMMIILIGNVKNGLVVMFPNFLPIIFGMGLMGYLGYRLDISTILCGSLAIGLVVDDTIHFMHTYQRYFQKSGSVVYAVEQTLLTTGRALMVTTLVLAIGFLVYLTAFMKNIQTMGKICAFIVAVALLADIMLVPAIVKIITREKSTLKLVDVQNAIDCVKSNV